MNRRAIAAVRAAIFSLAISTAFAASASDRVYEFNAVVECFTTLKGEPTCNLDMKREDLADIWGEDVAKYTVIVGLTEDAAEASQVGFDTQVAARFGEAHCTYRADVRLQATKGELQEEIIGNFPHFKLVDVLSHKALPPVCQANAHG